MKNLFTIAGLLVVTNIGILTFITPAVFGQENVTPGYIPPGCAGKTISKMSREEMLKLTVSDAKLNPPITPANQLKLFNTVAKIIDENYLYPDFKGLNWQGIVTEYRGKIERGMDTEKFYAEMDSFIRRLGDRHSSFESPVKAEAVKAQLAGQNNFVGVGALFQSMEKTKQVTILAVIPGSPAEHSRFETTRHCA